MFVLGEKRDPFPKTDLNGNFIGDKVPLCGDLPTQHFLKKGATYRLLGSSPQPELHEYGWEWHFLEDTHQLDERMFILDPTSVLKNKLSSKKILVTLDNDITCSGKECDIDSVMVVQTEQNPPIYYEYLRPQCVELSFYDNAKKIFSYAYEHSMCGNPNLDSAHVACCVDLDRWDAEMLCHYDFEKTSHSRARSRCKDKYPNGDICFTGWLQGTDECQTSSMLFYRVSYYHK